VKEEDIFMQLNYLLKNISVYIALSLCFTNFAFSSDLILLQ